MLSDEERRGSWERLRENMKSGGASEAAKRQMTPDEALAYMRGLRELALIKRQGYKRTKKAPPIEHEVRAHVASTHVHCAPLPSAEGLPPSAPCRGGVRPSSSSTWQ